MAEERTSFIEDLQSIEVGGLGDLLRSMSDDSTDIGTPPTTSSEEQETQPEGTTEPESQEPSTDADEEQEESGDDEPSEEGDEEGGLIAELQRELGYTFEEQFSDDHEGLVSFVKKAGEQIAVEQMQQVFAQLPDVQEYLQYRINGGDPTQFFEAKQVNTNFESLQFVEGDENNHKSIVETYLQMKGHDPEEIKDQVAMMKDQLKLADKAKAYLPKLKAAAQEYYGQLLQEQEKRAQDQQQQIVNYWKGVQDTIQGGKLATIKIPEAEKRGFYEWLAVPVKDNKPASQLQELSMEEQLQLEYIRYKKFDLGKMIQAEARKQNLDKYRAKSSKGMPPGGASNTGTRKRGGSAADIASMEPIF